MDFNLTQLKDLEFIVEIASVAPQLHELGDVWRERVDRYRKLLRDRIEEWEKKGAA